MDKNESISATPCFLNASLSVSNSVPDTFIICTGMDAGQNEDEEYGEEDEEEEEATEKGGDDNQSL